MSTKPRGRPPESGPPLRFIRSGSFADDPTWVVSEHDDPGEVAAAYAQQQMMAAVRRKAGGNVTAADVARALGREGADRSVPEVWAGRRAITMRMWFALAIAYDLDPLAYTESDDRRTLLPAAHRLWLGAWRPGDGLPRFRAPFGSDGEPAWINAAQWLSRWLDEEDQAGLLRLADTRIAVHATARALAEIGLPADLVADPSEPGRHARNVLSYDTEPRTDITIHLIPDSPLINRELLVGVIEDLFDLTYTTTRGRSMAVILAAPRSMRRLDVLIPGIRAAATVGGSVRVPSSTTRLMPSHGNEPLPGELTLTTLGVAFAANGYFALIYDLHKDGVTVL